MRNAFLIAAGLILATRALAQPLTLPPVGSRVRITYLPLYREAPTSLPKPIVATFAGARSDSLLAINPVLGDTMAFAIRSLQQFEVSAATYHPVFKTSLIGGLAVGGAAAVIGMFRHDDAVLNCDIGCYYEHPIAGVKGALTYGSIGAAVGIISGYLAGSRMTTDRWFTVFSFGRPVKQ